MARHVPNMSALALHPHPSVAIGAKKKKPDDDDGDKAGKAAKTPTSPTPSALAAAANNPPQGTKQKGAPADDGVDAKKQKTDQEKERAEFKKKLEERIKELISDGTIDDGEKGWTPTSDKKKYDPDGERCCAHTGSRLEDHLPEGLSSVPAQVASPKSPSVPKKEIEDPEAWERSQQEQAEAELKKRMDMSPEEWTKACGGKREAQIERIKKNTRAYKRYRHYVRPSRRQESKRNTTHPLTPDHNDRRYSNRRWAGAVRTWTSRLDAAWNDRPDDPKPEEEHESESEC